MNNSDKTILSARGIGKTVKSGDSDLVILREIDFSVTAGEAVAIVGASGSGKSTLLAILAGLDTPTVGAVAVDGEDLFGLDEDARAELRGRCVGFVFQSFQLLPSLTALENVMLPLELRKDPEAEGQAREILERVGLKDRLHHYPKHLSGGEQQRVALARALVNGPALILADEPTGNLDSQNSDIVLKMLRDANQRFGQTVLMITHNPEAADIGDRIIHMRDGSIVSAEEDPQWARH